MFHFSAILLRFINSSVDFKVFNHFERQAENSEIWARYSQLAERISESYYYTARQSNSTVELNPQHRIL